MKKSEQGQIVYMNMSEAMTNKGNDKMTTSNDRHPGKLMDQQREGTHRKQKA